MDEQAKPEPSGDEVEEFRPAGRGAFRRGWGNGAGRGDDDGEVTGSGRSGNAEFGFRDGRGGSGD